jgi:hypothetical protein
MDNAVSYLPGRTWLSGQDEFDYERKALQLHFSAAALRQHKYRKNKPLEPQKLNLLPVQNPGEDQYN